MRIQKHNVDMFSQWFNNDKKKAESMHPILKETWCQYLFEQYEPEYYHSYVVDNDPKHYRKWSVVNVSDGFRGRKRGKCHLATQPSS